MADLMALAAAIKAGDRGALGALIQAIVDERTDPWAIVAAMATGGWRTRVCTDAGFVGGGRIHGTGSPLAG